MKLEFITMQLGRLVRLSGEGKEIPGQETRLWEQVNTELCRVTKKASCRRCVDLTCEENPYRREVKAN